MEPTNDSKEDKYVVFDMDETLIYNVMYECLERTRKCNLICVSGNVTCIHIRPGVTKIFKWCIERGYKIVIFSAASYLYVLKMVDLILDQMLIENQTLCRPFMILAQESLTWTSGNRNYTKTIRTLEKELKTNRRNLAIIDDLPTNFNQPGDDMYVYRVDPWTGQKKKDDHFFDNVFKFVTDRFSNQ